MSERMEIVGRSSSHFTRMALIFAHELDVPVELIAVHDITSTDAAIFRGNPALKLPTLRRANGALVFGAENICRALAEASVAGKRIVWPEMLRSDLSRNAQEMVEHAMAAQVQWVIGTMVAKLPADNVYFTKGRAGFEGALRWLDAHLQAALDALPPDRDLSVFEVALFCLLDHLSFRQSIPVEPYPALVAFGRRFGSRASAQQTAYRYDARPT